MEFSKLKNEITLNFNPAGMPGDNLIRQAINETIRTLNEGEQLQRVLLTITGAAGGDYQNVDDISVNVDNIDENVDDMGLFKSGFRYDSANYILTIPETIIKIDDIYIDDVKQVPMCYHKMLNSYTEEDDWTYLTYGVRTGASQYGYTCFDNEIHFARDISTGTMKVVVYKEYDEFTEDTINVPNFFKQHLISSAVVILATYPNISVYQASFERHNEKLEKTLESIKQRSTNKNKRTGLNIW